jgi:glycosyltransferase involved in cell wall biosynthesis
MKKKELVLITFTFPFGKRESYLENEIGYLAAEFSKVHILVHSKTDAKKRFLPDNCYVHEVKAEAISLNLLSYFTILDLVKEAMYLFRSIRPLNWLMGLRTLVFSVKQLNSIYPALLKIIDREQLSDAVFYCYWLDSYALSLAVAKKNGKIFKAVSRAHNWDVYFELHPGNYLPFRKLLLENLDKVFTISENAQRYIESKTNIVATNKIQVARLGTLNVGGRRNPASANSTLVLLSCSTLIKRKRLDLIIDVVANVKLQTPVIWYHIGEEGEEKQRLLELINIKSTAGKQMIMLGHMDNHKILEFYTQQHIDLFVNLSDSEGVPVSIMEAYSAGIPAIATNVGGVAEVINKSNGYLVDVNSNADVIASKIEEFAQLTDDAKNKYRDNAFETWNKYYNANINYANFANVLTKL